MMTGQVHPRIVAALAPLGGMPAQFWTKPAEYQVGYLAGLRESCLRVLTWNLPASQSRGTGVAATYRRNVMLCDVAIHLIIRQQQGRLK